MRGGTIDGSDLASPEFVESATPVTVGHGKGTEARGERGEHNGGD